MTKYFFSKIGDKNIYYNFCRNMLEAMLAIYII